MFKFCILRNICAVLKACCCKFMNKLSVKLMNDLLNADCSNFDFC